LHGAELRSTTRSMATKTTEERISHKTNLYHRPGPARARAGPVFAACAWMLG
jgi:hypothetical protein